MRRRSLFLCLVAAALLFALLVAAPSAGARTTPLIVDHAAANLTPIPASAILDARATLHVAYGHTSHGAQLTGGMAGLVTFSGAPLPPSTYAFSEGGAGGVLDLDDYFVEGDLGNPDFSSWASRTRTYLAQPGNGDVNVVLWSWCGQVSWASEADIATYLSLMDGLEADYPAVTFVYMTGHLDGSGTTGTLHQRNEQIRAWCRSHDRVLYDFADIESYDPDGNGFLALGATDACDYAGGNWAIAWQNAHPGQWYGCDAPHTQPLNANLKAYAAWHLFARLAGWSPTTLPQVPGAAAPPTDTDGDGKYDDVNGNARGDFADIVLYFQNLEWIAASEPLSAFDYTGNGAIDYADVIWLFAHL